MDDNLFTFTVTSVNCKVSNKTNVYMIVTRLKILLQRPAIIKHTTSANKCSLNRRLYIHPLLKIHAIH